MPVQPVVESDVVHGAYEGEKGKREREWSERGDEGAPAELTPVVSAAGKVLG